MTSPAPQPSEGQGTRGPSQQDRTLLPRGFLLEPRQRTDSAEDPIPKTHTQECPPRPWPPPSPSAPHLCPVLQPLVELKYPVVGLVPVRRVPPAQRAEQAVRGGGSHGVGRGPKPTVGDTQPHQGWAESEQPLHQGHKLPSQQGPPPDLHAYPIPGSRYVGGYMGVGLGGAKKHRRVSAGGDPPPCPPQLPPPCLQQRAVGLAGGKTSRMAWAAP